MGNVAKFLAFFALLHIFFTFSSHCRPIVLDFENLGFHWSRSWVHSTSLYASHLLHILTDHELNTLIREQWSLFCIGLLPLSHNSWHFSWAFLPLLDFPRVSPSPRNPKSQSSIHNRRELHLPQPCPGLVLGLFLGCLFYVAFLLYTIKIW